MTEPKPEEPPSCPICRSPSTVVVDVDRFGLEWRRCRICGTEWSEATV